MTDEAGEHRTTSFHVLLSAPADPGSADHRIGDDARAVAFTLQALDEQGAVDTSFSATVDVYAHSLGALSGLLSQIPVERGAGQGTLTLPVVYGQTFLWIEDVSDAPPRAATFATGTSPRIWYREPFLADAQRSTSLTHSPLEGKQVTIAGSQHGAAGKLVVTGVYTGGYTVSDVDCAADPCVTAAYAHAFAFSSSRPVDVRGRPLKVGQTLKWFSGGIQEFNGFTEFNFPSQEIDGETPDPALLPDPVRLDPEWLRTSGADGGQRLEQNESALMDVVNARVCALDDDYTRFQEWKVDIGLGCGNPVTVVTAGQVAGFDPAAHVGQTLNRIVGTLKTVNLSFNVWILQPRNTEDIQ